MTFERLIRFVDDEGHTRYGDVPSSVDINNIVGQKVKVLEGSPRTALSSTQTEATVKEVSLHHDLRLRMLLYLKLLTRKANAAGLAWLGSYYVLSNRSISSNASVSTMVSMQRKLM